MLKKYLKFLGLNCKKFKKEHDEIFDILLYGSAVKGKLDFNDIDLMILFYNSSLNKRLEKSQKLKSIIKKEITNVDIKTMNINDFFDKTLLARQGLLIEGISLINNKSFAELLGFKGFSIFTYNLKNLNHNKKTQFTYTLIGRNSEGITRLLGGEPLGRGAVKIPIGHSIEFEQFLQKWEIDYKRKDMLESEM